MSRATGFTFVKRSSGDVVIFHHRRQAAVLRGRTAERFLQDVGGGTPDDRAAQDLMARRTGNYKRGNERGPVG